MYSFLIAADINYHKPSDENNTSLFFTLQEVRSQNTVIGLDSTF